MRWAVFVTVPLYKAQAQTSAPEVLYLKVNTYYLNPGLAGRRNRTARSWKPCMGCVCLPACKGSYGPDNWVTTNTNDCWQQAVASDCVNGEGKKIGKLGVINPPHHLPNQIVTLSAEHMAPSLPPYGEWHLWVNTSHCSPYEWMHTLSILDSSAGF